MIAHDNAGGGHAGGVLKVWLWWERSYLRRHRVRALTPGSAFLIEERRHHGPPVALPDGTQVRSGDRIVELHLANQSVSADATSRGWSPFQTLTATSADLALLARLVKRGILGDVHAVHAVSLIAPALGRVGFTVWPLRDTWHTRLLRFYLVGLLAVYHPDGWRGARRARIRAWPAEAWMSLAALERVITNAPATPHRAAGDGRDRDPLDDVE